ncbi:MAG: hypothetical protein HOQ36_15900, partial [Nocardia sp.]|nr:hypothetical protein [Nocardia sp.]
VVVLVEAEAGTASLRAGLRRAVDTYATERGDDGTVAVVLWQGDAPQSLATVLAELAAHREDATDPKRRIRLVADEPARGLIDSVATDAQLKPHRRAFTNLPRSKPASQGLRFAPGARLRNWALAKRSASSPATRPDDPRRRRPETAADPAAIPTVVEPWLRDLDTARRLARTTRANALDRLAEIATHEDTTVADLSASRDELVDERAYAQQRLIEKILEHEGFSPSDESSLLRIHADDLLARDDAPTDLQEDAERFAWYYDAIELIDTVAYLDDRIDRIDRLEAALFRAHALGAHDESVAGELARLQSHLSKLARAAVAIYRNDMQRIRENDGENPLAAVLADPLRQPLEDAFRQELTDALNAVAAIRALEGAATPPLIGDELNALGDRDADRRRELHAVPTTRDSDADSRALTIEALGSQRQQRHRLAEELAARIGTAPTLLTPARVRRIAEMLERQGVQDPRARAAAKCRALDLEIESSEELLAVTTRREGIDRLRAALFQAEAHLPVVQGRLVAALEEHRRLLDGYGFGFGAGLVDSDQVREQLRGAEQWRGGRYEHEGYLLVRAALRELLDLAGVRELQQWQIGHLQDLAYRLDALAGERTRVLDERAAVAARIEAQTELEFGWLGDDTERGARLRRFQAGRRAALAATIGPDTLAEHELTAADLTAEQISMLTLSRPALFADAELHGRVAELQRLERLIAEVAEFDLLTAQLDRIDEGLAKGLAADVDAVFAATVASDGAAADAEPAIGTVEHLWQPAERNCFVRSGLGVYEAAGGTAPAKLRGHVTGPAGVLAGESFDLLGADPREGGYRDLAAVAAHVKQTGDAVLVVVGFRGFTDASRPGSHAVQAFWDGEFDTRPNGTRVPVPGTGEVVVIDNGERSVFADWAAGQTGIRSVSGWEIMQGGTPRRPLVDGKSRAVAGLDYDNVGIAGRRTSLTDDTGSPDQSDRSGIEQDRGGKPSAHDPAPENPAHPARTITRPGAAEPVPAALTAEEAARVQQLYTAYSKPVLAQLVPRAGGDRELVRTVLQNTFLRLAGEI